MYTQYCYNYTKAITHLAQYKEKNTKFRSFLRVSPTKLKEVKLRSNGQNLLDQKVEATTMRLMDLLIMPVQRVSIYCITKRLQQLTLRSDPALRDAVGTIS